MSESMSRRQFLFAGAALGGAAAVGGTGFLLNLLETESALNTEAVLIEQFPSKFVPSVCSMCPSGCGISVRVVNGFATKIDGNPMHPMNTGALCPKGHAALELLYNPDRINNPLQRAGERGDGQWEEISWEEAVSIVGERLTNLRTQGNPEKVAFMYGETRGQMRPLIERFMQAIGSPNAISHDSLNVEAARLAMYLTQGVYELPAYDLENSNYVLSFGANLLEAGRVPQRMIAGYAFMRRGRSQRAKIVMIDPRQGITGAKADEWIPIKPGTDGALALAIAHVIIASGQFDSDFVNNYAFGFNHFTDEQGEFHRGFKDFVLRNYSPEQVEETTGVPSTTISRIAGEFASNAPAVAILPGKGGLLNGTPNGIYTAMAIHMLNALVGSIEKPGGVLRQRYMPQNDWPALSQDPIAEAGLRTERVDGAGSRFPLARHAYQAVADHVLEGHSIDTLFLYDANPVYEAPGGSRFTEAVNQMELVVSFSSFMDETAQYADLVLPDHFFLERFQDDHMEGLGYAGIGLRQPVVSPLYNTMNSADFLLQVAHEVGGTVADALPWETFEDVLKDRLSPVGADWDTLRKYGLWLIPGYRFARRGSDKWINEVVGSDRQNAPRDGRFDFFSREMWCSLSNLDAQSLAQLGISAEGDEVFHPHYEPTRFEGTENEFPFVLNVITLMSLGSYSANANSPTLQEISGMTVGETWDSWLEMNPESAEHFHLHDGDMVWVESKFGRLHVKLRTVAAVRPDVVNLPYNQGHKAVGRWAAGRGVNGLEILNPATESLTGLASLSNTRVKVYKGKDV